MTTRDERDERDGEYGIGRVPADVDPVSETLAQIEAVETMARMRPRQRPGDEVIECPNCGMPTRRSLLMSASLGTACPMCYDDLSE